MTTTRIEKRCDHGFERSVVKCPVCDQKKSSNAGRGPQPRDFLGLTIGGSEVVEFLRESENGHRYWRCICGGCGASFSRDSRTLAEAEKRGLPYRCTGRCGHDRNGAQPKLGLRPIPDEHRVEVKRASPSSAGPRYWRVEFDESGKVRSCVPCEPVEFNKSGRHFVYVIAENAEDAGRKAWNEHVRVEQRRRRERLVAEGKCPWCQRVQDRSPGKRCSVCLKKELACDQRRRDRSAGKDVESPSRVASLAASRADRDRDHRISILKDVRKVAVERSRTDFLRWLDDEITGPTKAAVG